MTFFNQLLSWYDENARTLPWRGSRDPYVIWVSEIIFQQTRIGQGMEYFHRFIDRFPTLNHLAAADQDTVLRLWQGLGYYSRARNMLFTARHIQEDLGGRFPDSFEKVLKLKGVGEYTAACIVSICFGEAQAAVDGNVYRVLSRYFADPIPIDSPAGKKHFRQLAQNLISTARPGDFNEAMMDLGAMICKPRNPECGLCPIQRSCIAMERQVQYAFPVKAPARVRPVTVMNYLIARTDGRIQIRQRSGTGIWKGLYELPLVTGDCSEQQILEACKNIYGLKVNSIIPVKNVRHQLSHTILDIRFFDAGVVDSVNKQDDTLLEVPESEVGRYPFPKPLVDYLGELNLPES